MAAMTASEPVLQKVARSIPVSSQIAFASFPAMGDWGPISTPVRSCFSTASINQSGEWPKK